MKVAVTGSAGFIGSHLVPALLAEGFRVASIDLPGASERERGGVERFPADVASGEGLPAAFAGADAVVHLAARNHVLKETARDPLAEYRRVNVGGTRNALRAAAGAGVRFFVHASSVKAVGEESEAILDEDAPCSPKTPYGISKRESETAVADEARGTGNAVVLRLPMVYGPGNRGNLPRMIRWAERGLPFPLFQPDNLRSVLFVENAVAGILAALRLRPRGVSTFFLKDREDCSTRLLYSAICRELGTPPRFLPVPAAIVRLGGMVSEDFRKVTGSLRVSSAKAEKAIGFDPPVSFQEGIARTVRWCRDPAL